MKKTIALLGLAAMLCVSTAYAATTAPAAATTAKPATTMAKPVATTDAKAPVPCSDMAKEVGEAMKGAKLSADKMKIATQHTKAGNNLCKVKKDAAADTEFSKVMKMLKKS
jgi:hypothetical protein